MTSKEIRFETYQAEQAEHEYHEEQIENDVVQATAFRRIIKAMVRENEMDENE